MGKEETEDVFFAVKRGWEEQRQGGRRDGGRIGQSDSDCRDQCRALNIMIWAVDITASKHAS